MFCPKCDSLMMAEKGKMVCHECGTSSDEGKIVDSRHYDHDIAVVDIGNIQIDTQIKADCDKCGHGMAYTWSVQTRSSDEPATTFFKCVSCGHQWREY